MLPAAKANPISGTRFRALVAPVATMREVIRNPWNNTSRVSSHNEPENVAVHSGGSRVKQPVPQASAFMLLIRETANGSATGSFF
jgi:hypothetical protein